jgi:ubiquinone/menaquinone biosynthesis C-methylase UbiE
MTSEIPNKRFIRALGFRFLTNFYDFIMAAFLSKNFREPLINRFNIEQKRVLDFGCGTGETAILFKKSFPKTVILGIDVDSQINQIAMKKIKKANLDIRTTIYDGELLPFKNSYFDCVTACLVFCNLISLDKKKSLNEINRVLKTEGQVLIIDWEPHGNKIKRQLIKTIFSITPFHKIIKESSPQLPHYLKSTGFRNVEEIFRLKTMTGLLYYYNAKK